jgi:hypothetical protein
MFVIIIIKKLHVTQKQKKMNRKENDNDLLWISLQATTI